MPKVKGVKRILKRAGELDKEGRIYSPGALAGAARESTIGQRPERHGMVLGLKYTGGELVANVYFPLGITPEDIGIEMHGEILRSTITKDSNGKEYQLVEEFRVDNIKLVNRAEAKQAENIGDREKISHGAPHYPPSNKLAGNKLGACGTEEECVGRGVAGVAEGGGEPGGEVEMGDGGGRREGVERGAEGTGARGVTVDGVRGMVATMGVENEEAQSAGGGI